MQTDVDQKLRKLWPVDPQLAASAWRLYLGSEGAERELTNELIDILLFRRLSFDFHRQL